MSSTSSNKKGRMGTINPPQKKTSKIYTNMRIQHIPHLLGLLCRGQTANHSGCPLDSPNALNSGLMGRRFPSWAWGLPRLPLPHVFGPEVKALAEVPLQDFGHILPSKGHGRPSIPLGPCRRSTMRGTRSWRRTACGRPRPGSSP